MLLVPLPLKRNTKGEADNKQVRGTLKGNEEVSFKYRSVVLWEFTANSWSFVIYSVSEFGFLGWEMCSDLLFFCLISWLDSRQLRISCVHKGESNDGKLVVNLRAKVNNEFNLNFTSKSIISNPQRAITGHMGFYFGVMKDKWELTRTHFNIIIYHPLGIQTTERRIK